MTTPQAPLNAPRSDLTTIPCPDRPSDAAQGLPSAQAGHPGVPAIVLHLRHGRVVGVVASCPVRVLVADGTPDPTTNPTPLQPLPGWGPCHTREAAVLVAPGRVMVVERLVAGAGEGGKP